MQDDLLNAQGVAATRPIGLDAGLGTVVVNIPCATLLEINGLITILRDNRVSGISFGSRAFMLYP
jgi:hypothetical protein